MKMKSEAERLFFEDLREKKTVSRSYRNKRTHCGRGGAVRLPSDKLTKKELEKMNGQCETYRLNQPMKWPEFLAMPVEHQIAYVKKLREKFDVPDARIARMMFVSQGAFSQYVRKLGISSGSRPGCTHWDKDGWYLFTQGGVVLSDDIPEELTEDIHTNADEMCGETITPEEAEFICEQTGEFGETQYANYEVPSTETEVEHPVEEPFADKENICFEECAKTAPSVAVPETGSLTFTGEAASIMNTLTALLGNTKVLLTVKWDVVE